MSVSPFFIDTFRILSLVSLPIGLLSYSAAQTELNPAIQIVIALLASSIYTGLLTITYRPVRRDLSWILHTARIAVRK
jgi:hypothetical protein